MSIDSTFDSATNKIRHRGTLEFGICHGGFSKFFSSLLAYWWSMIPRVEPRAGFPKTGIHGSRQCAFSGSCSSLAAASPAPVRRSTAIAPSRAAALDNLLRQARSELPMHTLTPPLRHHRKRHSFAGGIENVARARLGSPSSCVVGRRTPASMNSSVSRVRSSRLISSASSGGS